MITGKMLRDSFISGANNISNQKTAVDELNVFPVPDGDTGTNMSMTITAGAKELAALGDDCTVSQVADTAASALLRGARGNSGVILSLLFRGFSKGMKFAVTYQYYPLGNFLREQPGKALLEALDVLKKQQQDLERVYAEELQSLRAQREQDRLAYDAALEDMTRSSSWRLTAPLRALRSIFRSRG